MHEGLEGPGRRSGNKDWKGSGLERFSGRKKRKKLETPEGDRARCGEPGSDTEDSDRAGAGPGSERGLRSRAPPLGPPCGRGSPAVTEQTCASGSGGGGGAGRARPGRWARPPEPPCGRSVGGGAGTGGGASGAALWAECRGRGRGGGARQGLVPARQNGGRGGRVGAADPRVAAHRPPAPHPVLPGLPGPNQVMARREGRGGVTGRGGRGTEARLADRTRARLSPKVPPGRLSRAARAGARRAEGPPGGRPVQGPGLRGAEARSRPRQDRVASGELRRPPPRGSRCAGRGFSLPGPGCGVGRPRKGASAPRAPARPPRRRPQAGRLGSARLALVRTAAGRVRSSVLTSGGAGRGTVFSPVRVGLPRCRRLFQK